MSDIKRQVSKMLAEEIVQTIKKLTDDNNKQYVNNQIKNIGNLSANNGNSLVGGTISGNNFSQAIIDAIGKDEFKNDVSAAIVQAIIGKFESLIGDTGVIRELYGTYANFINMVAKNAQFDNVNVQNIWASIATMALARIDYLDVNHLIIRDKDGNRVSITVNEEGEIVTEEISDDDYVPEISGGFIHGGAIGDGTVTGTKLVANAIETSHISADTFAQLVLQKGGSIIDLIDDRMSLIVKDKDNDGAYSNIILTETMIKLISDAIRLNSNEEFSVAINDIANDIDAFSKLSATANKIYWLIADGGNSSAFTLTPEMIELVSKNIKLTAEQLNIVIKDLDMSENESVSSMIQKESGSKSTIYRDEIPPAEANKNDLWIQPSTGYVYQYAEINSDLPDFYIDDSGILYYTYGANQTVYEMMLDESGNLYIDSNAPFVVSISPDGVPIAWNRVKDSELEKEIEDAKEELNGTITNVQTDITAEIGKIQTTIGDVVKDDDGNIISLQSQITQTSGEISSIVTKNEELDKKIEENTAAITQSADAIDLRVTKVVRSAVVDITKNYTIIKGLFIDTASKKLLSVDPPDRVICVEGKPKTKYIIKKETATQMRVGCGSSNSLGAGGSLVNTAIHEKDSKETFTVETTENEKFIYIQLFIGADESKFREIEANMKTLMVYEDVPDRISKAEASITALDDSITTRVSSEVADKTGKINESISEIKQTADDITLQVSNIEGSLSGKPTIHRQKQQPTNASINDIWINTESGVAYVCVSKDGWASLAASSLDTSYIEIARNYIEIGSGGNLNVNTGAVHFNTSEYTLSILANDDTEEIIMDFDAESKTLLVDKISASNIRPFIPGQTVVYSRDIGGIEGLKGLLENAQYEDIVYYQTSDDLSSVPVEIRGCNSLNVTIESEIHENTDFNDPNELKQLPPIIFAQSSSHINIQRVKWCISNDPGSNTYYPYAISFNNSATFDIWNCYIQAELGFLVSGCARGIWSNNFTDSAGKCTRAIAKVSDGGELKVSGLIPDYPEKEGFDGFERDECGEVKLYNIRKSASGSTSSTSKETIFLTNEPDDTGSIGIEVGYWATGYKNKWNTDGLYQGYSKNKETIYGCMKFNLPAFANRTVKSAVLRLHRDAKHGKGAEVNVTIYDSETEFGQKPVLGKAHVSRKDAVTRDAAVSFDVTNAAQLLVNGTVRQLVLYNGDTKLRDNCDYSSNYANFDKVTLKIIYE